MKDFDLIFIVSQPRSGSTMLQALISNNDKVATLSEPWFLLPFLSYNNPIISNSIYNSKTSSVAINDFIEKIGVNSFKDDLSNFLLKQYSKARKNGETYVLDKTPRYYEILDELIEFFPGAKIIILKRNPFAVLYSIIKTFEKENIQKLVDFQRDLLYSPKKLHNFSKRQKNNINVRTVRYEDIVLNPDKEIKKLYKWLNLNFSQGDLNYKNNQKFKGIFGDPTGVNFKNTPDKEALNKWEAYTNNKYWDSFFKGYSNFLGSDFLEDYGYQSIPLAGKTNTFNKFIFLTKLGIPYHKIKKLPLIKYYIASKTSSFIRYFKVL